jgi:hypothetical protein
VGGSGYFDGSADYLSVANQTALQLSGNQFTIEGWFYFTTSGVDNYIVVQSSALADANVNWLVRVTSTNKLRVLLMTSGTTAVVLDGSSTVAPNQWNYFAVTCDGSGAGANIRSWLNGVYQGGTTVNAANINTNSAATQIGGWSFASAYSTGYISNLRIIKGNAVYTGTSDIGVPTAPLGSSGSLTSLLLNFTNAGVVDATAKNVLETVGNAQISTAQSKWGGGSIAFNGTNSYLTTPSSPIVALGSGDWTVEGWFYFANTTGIKTLFDQNASTRFYLYLNGTSLNYYTGGALQITGGTVAATTWHHIALVRSSGLTKLYLNGTQIGSTYTDSQNYGAAQFVIGSYFGGADYMNGYIDDCRISKMARYTINNFTPPTAPFPLQ